MDEFNFALGDVVLAEWEDKLFYAKIQKIDRVTGTCILIFDDDSVEECPFSKIHSVTETTAEIVCIICKDGTSLKPNEIVLCDKCGIGYHQHCHDPAIPATALEFDAPWMCVYCSIGAFCPYLENPFESKSTRKGVRKTRLHTLKTEESYISSGNSTEDEKDLPRETGSEVITSRDMSSYYLSSHMHQRDGSKPRGKPAFGHKSKSTGDKRGRGTGRPSGRPGVRDRDHYSDRNSELDLNPQRKSSHHYQRHGNDVSRHSGRYGSPVRRLGEDSEARKLSPTRESKKYQQVDENKGSKVVSHRRDAPREKQRLTQDLARQKRLLSEDIARAELLQREQLSKKYSDMFENRKENVDADRVADMDEEDVCKENVNVELCNEGDRERSPSMYERCYGEYSPEYNNEHGQKLSAQKDGSDTVCKLPVERESLFDRFLRKESVQEMTDIEFINESKVEVKGMRYTNRFSSDEVKYGADSVTNSDVRPELEPLKFENVTDDELTFSDGEKDSTKELKTNGGSPVMNKALSPVENGVDSASESICNGLEETCEPAESLVKNDLFSAEELITNLGYESCECVSEDGNPNCDDKASESNERCTEQFAETDHSSIKSSKIARLLEEPDMQCEHSSKNRNDCVLQDTEVSAFEINVKKTDSVCPTDTTEKRLEKDSKNKQAADGAAVEKADVREIQGSKLKEKEAPKSNSCSMQHNSLENVTNESELSNIEGMSDAGELSETEVGTVVTREKVKKKKRRKQKSSKTIPQSNLTNPRRKSKGNKVRSPVKDAKTAKRIKQLDSESDEDVLRNKSKETTEGNACLKVVGNCITTGPNNLKNLMESSPPPSTCDNDSRINEFNGHAEKDDETSLLSPNEDGYCLNNTVEEVVAMGTVGSDHCDSSQETNALSPVEDDGKKEPGRKEKRIGKTKRKSEEKEKEKDRSTPPHLISQNRYARDLPRHNWLVERLLQQNKLCAEDTIQHTRDTSDDQDKDENQVGDEPKLPNAGDKENPIEKLMSSPVEPVTETTEVTGSFSPKQQSDEENPGSPSKESIQNELHGGLLRKSFPPNVPRTLPRLKPSLSADPSNGSVSKPPPPPLKHSLSSNESCGLEPLPKLRKTVDENELENEPQEKKDLNLEKQKNDESGSNEVDQRRKIMSPIEILDDEDEKKRREEEETDTGVKASTANEEVNSSFNETSHKDGEKSPAKSSSSSPPDRHNSFTSPKKPFGSVNPTIPGNIREKFNRSMHIPPHRAAILIPVVSSMHDGGIPITPGLGPASPHVKGYSPRTFTPHLLTHGAPVPRPSMFGSHLSQGGRYSAANCGHHMHGNMNSGIPCKRDVNCPFHGNNPRGIPPGILDIPGHHGPVHSFGHHNSHDHLSAVMSRERREFDKGSCQSPPGRDPLGEKHTLQTPKVVKPIAHVPGKRPPLMLSHLQQIGKHSPASLKELEALHDEKARRYEADILLSPRQLQKSPDRSPREQVVPNLSPLHERRPHHQQFTLSELNRRREEEMLKGKPDEGLKPKPLPGEFVPPGLPSSARGPAKLTPPHSTEPSLLSPGRGHRSGSMSPVDKRDQILSLRRLVEDREPGAIMNDFLKPGPPRLRPVEEADLRLSSERQRREEIFLNRRFSSPFLRVPSTKESSIYAGKISEGVEIVSPRGIEPSTARERDLEASHLKSSHSSIMNTGIRFIEDKRMQVEKTRETVSRDEKRGREQVSPEMERRLRLEQLEEQKTRSRSSDLLQIKDKDPRIELRDKDSARIAASERDRADDLLLLRGGEESSRPRMPSEVSPSFRHKLYPERAFLPAGFPGRLDPRIDHHRMVALHELEMHRRGEVIRASEPSHRELLSRMASSLPISKGGSPIGKSIFVRPDGPLERRGPDSSRLPSEVHAYSPPTSLASREFGPMMNSRQAMERLAAAAGKPGSLFREQDLERDRERERQRLSLEQIEANRRLLHAELKDKVNPLVFSKEHQLRMEQKREHIDAMRAREKRLADRERFMFMERIAEERKRRFSELDSHGGILIRHSSPPRFGPLADREEYERVKRLKLSEVSVSSPGLAQHSKRSSTNLLHSERKEPKNHHILTSSQGRDKSSEAPDARINRQRENELVKQSTNSTLYDQDTIWHRNRGQGGRAQESMEQKRKSLHSEASLHGFMPLKGGPLMSQREDGKGPAGKHDDDDVNRCSVCKRDASFLCSGCQAAWYCSSECQLSAWGTHNRECSQNKRQ